MESLADNPAILLSPIATALFDIKFQYDALKGQVVLSKSDQKAILVSGNRHILMDESKLLFLSQLPVISPAGVALPPQDISLLLQNFLPSMDVSWSESRNAIEIKRRRAGKFRLKTIVVDPGHGGRDPGAVGRGAREKQVVLDIAQRLAELIESRSTWEVILTRDSDRYVTLQRRTEIANQCSADSTLFVSIHCNSDHSLLGRGLETFIFDLEATDAEAAALAERENADEKMDLTYILNHCYHVGTEPYSLEAAKKIQASLIKRLKLRNRGVKCAPFYVLAGTKMPAILIELGFISNKYDRKKLQSSSFRQDTAEALFDAIKTFDEATAKLLVRADVRHF